MVKSGIRSRQAGFHKNLMNKIAQKIGDTHENKLYHMSNTAIELSRPILAVRISPSNII